MNLHRFFLSLKEIIRFRLYLKFLKIYNLLIDRYHGIKTELVIELDLLGLNKNDGNRQESTPFHHLKKIFSMLDITHEDVFIDMGSGAGRTMIIAGFYKFKKIIGIDISGELNKLSKNNLETISNKLKCRNFVHVKSNASDYKIPDDATYIYFFNPFGFEVMKNVFESIMYSLSKNQRKITVIWYNPKYENDMKFLFPLVAKKTIIWKNFWLFDSKCVIYEI